MDYDALKPSSAQTGILALNVNQDGGKTVYTARFPLKELGVKEISPGSAFGFSILVNDNDGTGRKGYLHWANGIGDAKDPAEFGGVILKGASAQ